MHIDFNHIITIFLMEIIQEHQPELSKPIIIAAMQDMGSVGSIVIEHINSKLKTRRFRTINSIHPTYVIDEGGYINVPLEKWEYRNTEDLIIFGGASSQPQSSKDIHEICQDVIDVAKKFSAKFIYTLGGFHTNRDFKKFPKTYVTTTSLQLKDNIEKLGLEMTPQRSVITGFNGIILGYAKRNGINGMGLYAELNEPGIPQYRAAKSIIQTLEKLTFQKFGNIDELDIMAENIDKKFHTKWSSDLSKE